MLLVMYKEDDDWEFLMPNYTMDLRMRALHDEVLEKIKMGSSKIGESKIHTSNLHI